MPWNEHNYPPSMKHLLSEVRNKAIEIANALLEEGMEEGRAIPIATAQAKKWHEVHYPDHSGREDILHVVPAGEDWAVTAEGREHPLMTAQTKQEAVQYAQHRKADIVIHRQDGTIQSRRTT
ncbi:DUF2188 domain-containing protein [Paenibacillus thiaminolyticus]|uniref:DUF2188 domain-containing protein n=1 Tax=Paenibacillus thiaminolyticus TaxID=49283 RepID=UPI00234FC6B2|nr:DUF2188 domain-containing protein [Paenibacillus thiaminolyticus]MDG0871520.1 DUF2188 domain-containing protein [Paenibacillus thiaminolyticus]WCR29426.1 DUF2188 domain-containing protein [Paenibacillus thiaminolyticus]